MAQNSREQKKKKVIEVLNKARSMELHAIHQYMNQHYNLDDMDYGELAAKLNSLPSMKCGMPRCWRNASKSSAVNPLQNYVESI
jgi:hypothetical protein